MTLPFCAPRPVQRHSHTHVHLQFQMTHLLVLASGGTVTVSLNNVTIGTGSVISNVAGRRRLLALTSDFLISITVPAATQPGSLVSAVYKYAI